MRRYKLEGKNCLRCNTTDSILSDYDYIRQDDYLRMVPILCTRCNAHWYDFEGINDATSPVISIQRKEDNSESKPTSESGDNTHKQ